MTPNDNTPEQASNELKASTPGPDTGGPEREAEAAAESTPTVDQKAAKIREKVKRHSQARLLLELLEEQDDRERRQRRKGVRRRYKDPDEEQAGIGHGSL